jgi:hypothetical protein
MMNAWLNDPFFQYPTTTAPTSEGDCTLPIMYFENSNMITMYAVDYEAARAMMAPKNMTPIRFMGGKAMVSVAFFQYRNCAINPYNEVGAAIAALPNGTQQPALPLLSLFRSLNKPRAGFYVIDLPVTTKAACAAGREIWGYPKFVTPISFDQNGARFSGEVSDPGGTGDILTLSGKAGLRVPGPLLDLSLYSTLDGKIQRTLVNTRGGAMIGLPGSIRLRVSDSDHVMAKNLRALGLKDAKPSFLSYSNTLQLRLNAGRVVA